MITKSISYGVMFGIIYGLPLGRWFGLAGLLVSGPVLSLEIGRREVRYVHPFYEALAFGLLRAASFGAAGWLAKDAWFGISFGILSAIGLVATYLIVGPPPFDVTSGRAQIDKTVIKRAALRGASIGLAAILSGATHSEPERSSMASKWDWSPASRVAFWWPSPPQWKHGLTVFLTAVWEVLVLSLC